jgi:hypothetical protein
MVCGRPTVDTSTLVIAVSLCAPAPEPLRRRVGIMIILMVRSGRRRIDLIREWRTKRLITLSEVSTHFRPTEKPVERLNLR